MDMSLANWRRWVGHRVPQHFEPLFTHSPSPFGGGSTTQIPLSAVQEALHATLPYRNGMPHFGQEVVALIDTDYAAKTPRDMIEQFLHHRQGYALRGKPRGKRPAQIVDRPVRKAALLV